MKTSYKVIILTLILLSLPVLLLAQRAEIPSHREPYFVNSGLYDGPLDAKMPTIMAYSNIIQIEGVPWLRLIFSDISLGKNSYITLTSLKDGAFQQLDAKTAAEWRNTSAFFNGDAVEIALHTGKGDKDISFRIEEVLVGDWLNREVGAESQCGPNDDRIPSSDPASGRIFSVGCTGWITSNGTYVSAGHCLALGSLNATFEFNVPESLPDGTLQHPGPEDQYSIDQGSFNFVNGGVGNDWGTFEVFDNSQTGLQPIAAQGASYTVAQNLGTSTIRITGYGVDFDDANLTQTQQTHTGPDAGSSGTTMRYQADTEGGNSGSPVIDEDTGFAVGVHTHGGCSTAGTGNNSGTSTFSTAFWDALQGGGGGGDEPPVVSDIPDETVADGDRITYSMNDFVDDPDTDDADITWSWSGNSQLTVAYRSSTQQIRVTVPTGFSGSETVTFTATDPEGNSDSDAVTYSEDGGGGGGDPPVVSDIPDHDFAGGNATILSMNDHVDDPDHADSEITWSWTGNTDLIVIYRSTTQQIRVRRPAGWTGTETITFTATDPDGNSDSDAATFSEGTSQLAGNAASSVEFSGVPETMVLERNYPNPFNPSTSIVYGLNEGNWVTLKIYNSLGQEIRTLVNEYQSAGYQTVVWNGRDDAGRPVSSGIYVYRMTAGDFSQTHKMVFSK